MFTKPGILLFLFFIVQISLTKEQDCQSFLTCNSTCSWVKCCAQIGCTNCAYNHTFSCQTEIITGNYIWCYVQVNDPHTPSLINTINITFESSNDCICTSCINGETMCCGSVILINCSTVSSLTSSSQSSAMHSHTTLETSLLVTSTVSSSLIGLHLLLTSSQFTTPSSSVPGTSTISVIPLTAVAGAAGITALILLVVITPVIAISCIVVVIRKKHSRGKQTEAQKQNWNIDMAECEAYGKLEVNSEKIDMTACSAYGTLQTLQSAVDPEYEDVSLQYNK